MFEHLCLAAVHQDQSSSRITHIQRLIVLVQHQDSAHPLAPYAYQKADRPIEKASSVQICLDCSGYFICNGRPAATK